MWICSRLAIVSGERLGFQLCAVAFTCPGQDMRDQQESNLLTDGGQGGFGGSISRPGVLWAMTAPPIGWLSSIAKVTHQWRISNLPIH